MKRTKKFLLAILACGALTLLATACGKKNTEDNNSSVSINEGVNSQSGISFKTLTVDGTNVYGKVSNSTETFSFIDEILQTANSRFIVSLDICGLQQVATKMIPLAVGDNQVYITEIVDDEPIKVYTLIVRRRPMYEITFNTNGGTSVQSQTVEEDSCAIMPLKEPTRLGYGFNGWNYDFTKLITDNTVINAKWESIFTLSGNTITGLTEYGKNNYKQLNIPSKIDGITITNIGDGAFV